MRFSRRCTTPVRDIPCAELVSNDPNAWFDSTATYHSTCLASKDQPVGKPGKALHGSVTEEKTAEAEYDMGNMAPGIAL